MRVKLLGLFLVMVANTGCIITKVKNPDAEPGEVKDYPTTHWAGGFGESVVQADCPNGFAEIAQGQTFGNGFMTGITLGIYRPGTVRVTCAK